MQHLRLTKLELEIAKDRGYYNLFFIDCNPEDNSFIAYNRWKIRKFKTFVTLIENAKYSKLNVFLFPTKNEEGGHLTEVDFKQKSLKFCNTFIKQTMETIRKHPKSKEYKQIIKYKNIIKTHILKIYFCQDVSNIVLQFFA